MLNHVLSSPSDCHFKVCVLIRFLNELRGRFSCLTGMFFVGTICPSLSLVTKWLYKECPKVVKVFLRILSLPVVAQKKFIVSTDRLMTLVLLIFSLFSLLI